MSICLYHMCRNWTSTGPDLPTSWISLDWSESIWWSWSLCSLELCNLPKKLELHVMILFTRFREVIVYLAAGSTEAFLGIELNSKTNRSELKSPSVHWQLCVVASLKDSVGNSFSFYSCQQTLWNYKEKKSKLSNFSSVSMHIHCYPKTLKKQCV